MFMCPAPAMYIHHLLDDVLLLRVTDTMLLLVRGRRGGSTIESDGGGGGVCCVSAVSRNFFVVVALCVSCLNFPSVVVGGIGSVRDEGEISCCLPHTSRLHKAAPHCPRHSC